MFVPGTYTTSQRWPVVLFLHGGGEQGSDGFLQTSEGLGPAIPIWMFHGDADNVIAVEESRRLAQALRQANAPVTYTELAGVGHNAWDTMYGKAEVAQWLFAQRLTAP